MDEATIARLALGFAGGVLGALVVALYWRIGDKLKQRRSGSDRVVGRQP